MNLGYKKNQVKVSVDYEPTMAMIYALQKGESFLNLNEIKNEYNSWFTEDKEDEASLCVKKALDGLKANEISVSNFYKHVKKVN